MNEPLVSIVILTFNRKDELRKTLRKVYQQEYQNFEIILIDNNSSDDTKAMIKNEYPHVKLIEMPINKGAPAFNEGFRMAKGKYIFILDDDSNPVNNTIKNAVKMINSDSSIGIVACNIYNKRLDFYETAGYEKKIFSFVGCGALVDREKLNIVGYYDENIFLYNNEIDLTARFLNKGFKIIFCEDALVIHRQSLEARGNITDPFANKNRYLNYFWSMSYFLFTKFYFKYSFIYLIKWFINRLLIALKYFYFKELFQSIFKLFINLPLLINNRAPLKQEVQKYYNYGNLFPFIDRDFFPNFNNH